MTPSSDSSTAAGGSWPRGIPWRTLALLLVFLAGTGAAGLGLERLRSRFRFESFSVNEAAPIPLERVRLKGRETFPAHFLLLHGYGANRRHLLQLAEVLAAAGGEVYLMDLPGRGDHPGRASPRTAAGFDAAMPTPQETDAALAVLHHLESRFGVRPERLVVVGHSMGGGVALDLGLRARPAATVSLAGLERPVTHYRPENLLLVTARVEIPNLRRAADRMYERARRPPSGDYIAPLRRASALAHEEFFATHSSLPFHSPVQRAIAEWTNRAVPRASLSVPPLLNEKLLGLVVAGVVCLAGLFAPLAGLAGWALAPEPFGEVVPETRFTTWSPVHLAGYGALAGAGAVSSIELLKFLGWPAPLDFLRLDGGAYLASVALLATLWLLPVLLRRPWVRSWRETGARAGAALALAAFVIVAGGGFVAWQFFDLWPTPGRLARMLAAALLLLPYALGEELLGRTYAKGARSPSAFDAFLAWRLGLFAALFYGALVLGSGERMLVVMAIPLALLSLVEYYFAAALYRNLTSAYAAAVLKAALVGWILATIFPLQ